MTKKIVISAIVLMAIVTTMGIMPAYATIHSTQIIQRVEGVDERSTYISEESTQRCAGVNDACGSKLKVKNGYYNDFIYTYYKIGGKGVMCDMNTIIKINGEIIADTTYIEKETYGKWKYGVHLADNLQEGDTIETITTFSSCWKQTFTR